jgi:hypothetical protein
MGRWRLVLGLAAAAAIPVSVALADGSTDLAAGGGQLILRLDQDEPERGAGPFTTIAFNSRQLEPGGEAAEGEVQEVDRTHAFAGAGASVYHAEVFCMAVQGKQAVIAYRSRRSASPDDEVVHRLFVSDDGEGATDDTIILDREPAEPYCGLAKPSGTNVLLGRGNVQVFDNTP